MSLALFKTVSPVAGVMPKQLVEEILFHSQEVLRLKTLLNARRPVSKLPSEILATIFLLQAEEYQEETLLRWRVTRVDDNDTPAHKSIYTWTSVALVCRHWREVALQCARLWTCLVLDERVSADYIHTILQRAQGLPLTVVVHAVSETHCAVCVSGGKAADNYAEATDLLEEVLPNTRRLALFIGEERCDDICSALCTSAPRLEWLHVEAVGWYASSLSASTSAVSLPDDVFSPGLPPLRYLSVSRIEFDWDFPLLIPTLRHIKVAHRKSDPDGAASLTLAEMVDVLHGMPQLETLDIDRHSMPVHNLAVQCNPVFLPHLRFLRLSLDTMQTFHLVSYLRFFPNTTIHLEKKDIHQESLDPVALGALQQVIATVLKDMAVYSVATRFPRTTVNELDRPPTCRFWAEAIAPEGPAPVLPHSWDLVKSRPPRLVLEFRLGSALLNAVFATLDLRHLRVLSIQELLSVPPPWVDMFKQGENVAMIDVKRTMAFGLGAALVGWVRPVAMDVGAPISIFGDPIRPASWVGFGEVPDDTLRFASDAEVHTGEGEEGTLSVVFPHLRVLRISQVDFPLFDAEKRDKRWRYRKDDVTYGCNGTPYGLDDKGLARSLRLRLEHGATRLDRLEFWDCQCIERERLVPLLDVVSELWWDGRRLTSAYLPAMRVL